MRRRAFISTMAFVGVLPQPAFAATPGSALPIIAALERHAGGRLGVYARDTANERTIAYRASERFPMCSTFKLLLVGAVRARVDRGIERLDRRIRYTARDLLPYAPVSASHVRRGTMSVEEACAAAIRVSDNTAANLLLRIIGGSPAVTRFVRTIGARQTRLDRMEPELNSGSEHEVSDPADGAKRRDAVWSRR